MIRFFGDKTQRHGFGPPFLRAALFGGAGVTYLTEQQIAALATNPSEVSDLIIIGDSRLAAQQSVMIENSPEIIYSGCHGQSYNAYNFGSGHTSAAGSYGGAFNIQPTSPYIGGQATWAPANIWEAEFTGSNMSSGDLLTRLAYGGPNLAGSFSRIYDRLTGGSIAATCRAIIWGGAHGLDGSGDPDVRMWHRPDGVSTVGGTGSQISANVSDTTTPGYSEVSISIADSYDWATNCSGGNYIEWNTPSSEPTTASVVFALASMPWLEIDAPGVVVHDYSFGGRSIEGFLPSGNGLGGADYDPSVWTDYIPLLGDRPKLFWIDLGTNNAASNTQTQHEDKLKLLIGYIRAGTPDASILLTSAYESSTSGSNPYYRAAAAAVASEYSDQGVLYVDTYGLLPSYTDGNAAGLYADATHYNDTGRAARAAVVGNELALKAEGIDFATRDWQLEWEWDADVRDSITIGTGVSDIADRQASARLTQSTGANQPTRILHSANWGLTTAIGFDGSNDVLVSNGGDITLADLRFLHDCTVDYELIVHFRMLTGYASGSMILGTTVTLAGVGISLIARGTNEMRFRAHTTSGTVLGQIDLPASTIIPDTAQMARLKFTASSETWSLQVDEGTPGTVVKSGTESTGDSAGGLHLGGWSGSVPALCEVGYLSISKTIADGARQAKQERFFEIKTNREI